MKAGRQAVAEQIEAIRRHLAQGEPDRLRAGYLADPSQRRPVWQGTTATALVPQWRQRGSGLFVPASIQPLSPIDLTAVYLTAEEVLGFPLPASETADQLRRLPLADVLRFCAYVLNLLHRPGLSAQDIDRHFTDMWFAGDTRTRVHNLLRDPSRRLVVPQALMLLARTAFDESPDTSADEQANGFRLVHALLALTQHMGAQNHDSPSIISDRPGDLGRDLIANQHFHHPASIAGTLARYARRWLQMPAEHEGEPGIVDLAHAYQACTGIPLEDLAAVVGLMWVLTENRGVVSATELQDLSLPPARIDAVLDLVSTDLPGMRQAIRAETPHQRTEWSFDPFQRWPVLRLPDGGLLILDRSRLINRAFGWLPILDIQFPPAHRTKPAGHRRLATHATQTLRHFSEVYVSEVLHSITRDTTTRRVYDDADLKGAYTADGQRIADAAIDYPGTWIVIEVTTTRLRREAANGVPDDSQIHDMDKLVDELEQVDATIAALRRDETALTGAPAPPARHYLPLLVLPEGFPVNPITLTVIRERARARGLFTNPDTDLVEIVDIDELEMIEFLQEHAGRRACWTLCAASRPAASVTLRYGTTSSTNCA